MPKVALTDRFIASVKPLEGAQTDYFDATVTGLALRVTAARKVWSFVFTSPKDGKRARMTLGTYPALSLAAARGLALEAKGATDEGKDPRDVRAAQDATAMTVADLFTSYLAKYARPSLRSAGDIERRLNVDVVPVIGQMKLAELHRRDINRVLDPILERDAPTQARIVFQNMRAILRWAVQRGDLDHSPMEGMRSPVAEAPRERALSEYEIRTLWLGLPKVLARSEACQRIVQLCLLTAQRVGEISGMRRDELDLKAGLWSLPGSRTKNGHPHIVALAGMAVAIIAEALADAGESAFVFPTGEHREAPLEPSRVSRTLGRANEIDADTGLSRFRIAQFTAHDLRRTAITGMARLGISPVVLGHIANHRTTTHGGITMAVYVQHSYDKEKRQALDLWADRIEAIVSGTPANIIPLRA